MREIVAQEGTALALAARNTDEKAIGQAGNVLGQTRRRLVLRSDAYQAISKALAERIAEIEAQKQTAPLTDIAAV